ncbi:hypothetical protein ACHAXA_007740, partial [Cyclostephanos tholiformis]
MKRPPCLVVTILASMVGIVAPSNTSAVRGGRGIHHASDDGLSDEYHKPKDIPSIRTVPVSPASATAADRSNLEGRLHAVQEVLGHRPHPSYLDQTIHYYPTKQSNDGRHQHQRQRSLNHPAGRIMRNLVLLLRFSDHVGRTLPSRIDVWRLYNYDATDPFAGYVDDIVPTGSVRQLYEFNSHSTFTVETTVVDWITLSKPESYYGNGDSGFTKFKEAIIEALTILDSGVGGFDFTNFDLDENGALDGFGVLHSGYGAEYGGDDCHGAPSDDRIWSHKGGIDWTSSQEAGSGDAGAVNRFYASSSLRGVCNSNIVRMGVIVHELGHYLGLPDLYDETFDGSGLGAYDFMSQSWGLDGSGMYPPTLSAWSKVRLGWAKVEVIAYDGTYRLESSASSNTVYKIEAGYPEGEYLLIENRQPTRYDRMMEGGGGLAIYHIDDKVGDQNSRGFPSPQSDWPIDGRHYQVALLAADGKYDLERGTNQGDSGDLWHSGSALKELRSGSASYPNTDSYQSGNVTPTGVRIYGFGDSGNLMTFRVAGLGMREAGGGSTDGIARQRSLNHPAGGIMRNLVLLLRFSDHVGRTLPSRIDVWRLYNYDATDPFAGYVDDIVPTGSVRQLYEFNSHSTFTVETTVVDWITLSKPESYYGNGDSGFTKFKEAIIEALTILDTGGGGFDFTNFDLDENGALDGFGVLHSGYGAEYGGDDCHGAPSDDRIWSHKGGIDWTSSLEAGSGETVAVNRFYASSSLRGVCNSNIVRMGVIVHELGHYLGLPDLYDETFDGSGLGAYDFMSQSWGLDGSGMYPPTLSAWSKVRLGWAKVEVIAYDGTYRLESSASSNTVYKIEAGYPEGEYLLIENRQPTRYDRMMEGGGGLAIYHIDDKVGDQNSRGFPSPQSDWPIDGRHYQVALLAADGKYDLERGTNQGDSGDLWHSGSALKELRSGSASYPNTDSYQSGNVTPTGVRIYGFGDSGNLMTFRVAGLGMREAGGGSTDGIA